MFKKRFHPFSHQQELQRAAIAGFVPLTYFVFLIFEVIAIAHRLSTIRGYDEICVLQNGEIAAWIFYEVAETLEL